MEVSHLKNHRSRSLLRHHRFRYIRRRLKIFQSWLLRGIDSGVGLHLRSDGRYYANNAPRPLEIRFKEFWTPTRIGRFAKWNGVCSCSLCRDRKTREDRPRMKSELRQIISEYI